MRYTAGRLSQRLHLLGEEGVMGLVVLLVAFFALLAGIVIGNAA